MKNVFLSALVFFSFSLLAQNLGDIRGKVVDQSNNMPLPEALVSFSVNGELRQYKTDSTGTYDVRGIPVGKYSLLIQYQFYGEATAEITVSPELTTVVPTAALAFGTDLPTIVIREPMIEVGKIAVTEISSEDLAVAVSKNNLAQLVTTFTPGVTQSNSGQLYFKGSRSNASAYYLDGVKMEELPVVPSSALQNVQVYTTGLPAQYGDVTGGVVVITTKTYFDLFHQRNR